jgi:hypothetical protein
VMCMIVLVVPVASAMYVIETPTDRNCYTTEVSTTVFAVRNSTLLV